jgi:hypothetical protein
MNKEPDRRGEEGNGGQQPARQIHWHCRHVAEQAGINQMATARRMTEHTSWRAPCCAWVWLTLACCAALSAADEPKIIGSPMVVVDRLTGGEKTPLYLINSTNADIPVSLSAIINSASKTSRTKVLFSEVEQGPGSETLNLSVKKGPEARTVWVFVTEVWEPGDTDVDLVDKDAKLGKLKIRRLPVTIKLDGPSPDKAELSLVDGEETRLILKNDDPVKYAVGWKLFLGDTDVCAGKLELQPNGIAELRCTPKIGFRLGQLTKDDTREGRLLVSEATNPAQPLKSFPVKAAVGSLSRDACTAWAYVLIVGILTCGGISSLLLSQFVPNRLQRLNIQDQLDAIARTTADLSDNVDSKLSVQIRIERIKLQDLLRSRTTVSPDFAGILAQCSQGIAQLSSRVRLLQQMDLVLAGRQKLTELGVAPTLVDQMDAQLGKAVVLLGKKEPTDADTQAAATAVATATSLVDTLIQPGADFGQSLGERIKMLVDDINANFANNPVFTRVSNAAPGAWKQLKGVQPGTAISPDQYTSLDMAVAKLLVMREYTTLVEGTTKPELLRWLQKHCEPQLTKYLQLSSWEVLCLARLLLREMREGVYPEMLREALADQRAVIEMNPAEAYHRAPLRFYVEFQFPPWNTAAARESLTCHWDFGDGYKGTGWEVSHYFEAPALPLFRLPGRSDQIEPARTYRVSVTFQDESGETIIVASAADPGIKEPLWLKRDVSVRPTRAGWTFGERAQTEYLKLLAALLIAVFGLVTGAKDQLAKLDLLPGLVAVFLVGFGADTIKNLLTSK